MSKSEIIRFLILRSIGNFLVLFAIFGVLSTFGPVLYYEALFRIVNIRGIHYKVVGSSLDSRSTLGKRSIGFADILAGAKEQILMPIDTQFSILIPKIGANAKVYPNIDPSDPNIFLPFLRSGVAHARGTVFPGQNGSIYLFAHSTDNFWNVGRYNALFYLIKDLGPGDEVVIFFQDKRYNYVVSQSRVVEGDDISYITEAQEGEERLILQTCWPPGTTWKRLLVFARPK
jgi:sortase A